MLESPNHDERPEFDSWMSYWEFAAHVRSLRRYVWGDEVQRFLNAVLGSRDRRNYVLRAGTTLWRVQMGVDWKDNDDGIQEPMGFLPERMKPYFRYVGEGRANTAGIPVLYLASTEEAAISEIRPWVGSNISVAQFEIVRDLKAVDLSLEHGNSSLDGLTLLQLSGEDVPDAETKEKAVWTDIDNAFSRPVTLSENLSDYVPTQILAESFRQAGHDAIIYRSSFGENGYNIAIFDPEDAKILNCGPYEVTEVRVDFREVGDRWYSR